MPFPLRPGWRTPYPDGVLEGVTAVLDELVASDPAAPAGGECQRAEWRVVLSEAKGRAIP